MVLIRNNKATIITWSFSNIKKLFVGRELPDALSLEDCGVENGSTLKLILAMRGGPINTRRVVIPSSNVRNTSGGEAVGSSNNIEDIMLKNKEKILDKIPKNGQVCYIRLIFEN